MLLLDSNGGREEYLADMIAKYRLDVGKFHYLTLVHVVRDFWQHSRQREIRCGRLEVEKKDRLPCRLPFAILLGNATGL